MRLDIHVHLHADEDTQRLLNRILHNTEKMMHTLDEDLAAIQAQSTKLDGINTMITGLKQQIADALSGVTVPPAVQAKIDAVFDGLAANDAKLATALDTGPTGAPLPPAP